MPRELEQYYLFLKDNNDVLYRVHKNPVSLRKMDERTTKYKGERSLIKQILSNRTTTLKPDDIKEVIVMRRTNKKSDNYKVQREVLYKKDEDVLNEEMTIAKLELRVHDKEFVRYLLKPYLKIKGLSNLASEIKGLINSDSDYFRELQELLDKVTKTYKGNRSIYFTMKNYDKDYEIKNKPHFDASIIPPIDDITEDDIIIDELEYLKKYDRELLDIEDFRRHQSISPFDDNPKRIR